MSTYDASLLKDSPEVSNLARQEGYNVDLLAEKPASRPISPSVNAPVHTRKSVHPPGRTRLAEEDVPPIPMNNIEKKRKPFWRTTKGLALIAVGIIVIIGAIVGGAVGGAVAHRNKKPPPNSAGAGAGDLLPSPSPSPSNSATASSSSSNNILNSITAQPQPTTTANGSNGANTGGGGGANTQEVRRGAATPTTTHTTANHEATHAKETPSKPLHSEAAKVTPTAAFADAIGRVIGGHHL